MSEPAKGKSTLVIVLMVVGAVLVGGVVIVGILAALGISGVRSYLSRAKGAEGKSEVYRLARGIARCAESGGPAAASGPTLPPSAPPVPASLADVAGRKYMSSATDWSQPTYKCASFEITMPQYFQYEWQQVSPTSGKAIARADLNGDGKVDQEFTSIVTCSGTTCNAPMPVGP